MAHRPIIIILLLYSVHRNNAELSCYVCGIIPNIHPNRTIKSCTTFEKTEEFKIFCPYSTFCMKKITELVLQNGDIERTEERGCASQKNKQHRYKDGKWVEETDIITELYQDGCFPEKPFKKAAKSKYCYCSSNYCNSGKRTSETSFFHHTDAMSVIFIFNVVKFMRNVR